MKKFVLVLIIGCAFAISTNAQITKASVERMLTELGSSIDKVETLYIGNMMIYYTDGTHKMTYTTYNKNNGDYLNTLQLTNEGIVLKTKKNGAEFAREIFPYNNIKRINIERAYISIFLND
jgi:hypothetical protein